MTRNFLSASLRALALATSLTAVLAPNAWAFDESSTAAVNVDAQSLALRGHDVVAYFDEGAPRLGTAAFTARHEGVVYRFASATHRDAFVAHPARYLPQFGGFCAMGVALGRKLDGDPTVWRVVDGKLYLNVTKDVQVKWLSDVPSHLKAARQEWPALQNRAPRDL